MRRSVDWCGSGAGVVRRVVWAAKSELQALSIFRWSHVTNIFEHQTKAVFHLKLMVGWGEYKVVLDESGLRAYHLGRLCLCDGSFECFYLTAFRRR